MSRRKTPRRARKAPRGGGLDSSALVGLGVGLLALGGVAVVMSKNHPVMQPPAKSGGKPAPGVPLAVEGQQQVGMTSSIPQAVGYDTGPVDMTYNPDGWDYAAIGIKA